MRVLIISVRADFGGGPEHIYQLIKNSKKIEFFIACPNDKPYYKRFKKELTDKRMIEIPHRKFNFSTLIRLIRFIKKNRIQLIHSHGKGAGIYSRPLALLTNKPCIHTFHGLHIEYYNPISKFLYINLERSLSLFTKKIIAVSSGEKNLLLKNRIASAKKINLIENGIEIPDNIDNEYKEQKNIKIITANRFNYQKNADLILKIAIELKKISENYKFKIEVLGTGEDFEKINETVKNQNLTDIISLLGAKNNPRDYYKNALCFLSTSRWEGMPLAPLEAMSEGIPVIATNVVGNKDIIIDKRTGLLFDLNLPKQGAELIKKLVSSLELRNTISKNGYEHVKNKYNVKTMVENTVGLYRKNQAIGREAKRV